MWFVYLLQQTETKEMYIGTTQDLDRRLKEHNTGSAQWTARDSGKWVVIYFEAYRSKQDADERERMLKHHGSAKRKLLDRVRRSFL